jgi:hypothetical protein
VCSFPTKWYQSFVVPGKSEMASVLVPFQFVRLCLKALSGFQDAGNYGEMLCKARRCGYLAEIKKERPAGIYTHPPGFG